MGRGVGEQSQRRLVLAATEPARAAVSVAALATALPLLTLAPRGKPHPVLVLPGWLTTDVSTGLLRRWLRTLGYPVVGWELGRNHGPTPLVTRALAATVQRMAEEHGTPVSLVGQSLGGILARRLAREAPQQVRQVVTLGSPFGLLDTRGRSRGRPLPVPSTSIYSRADGVVDWRACRQSTSRTSENIAVHTGHLGMGVDPTVLWIVADRLAQPAGKWRPFRRPSRFGIGLFFPDA